MTDRRTLTIPEAAIELRISRAYAYQLAREGTLPVVHFGRRVVVPARALDALLEKRLAEVSA